MGNELPPFGRFSPTRGLWIDRTDRSISISGAVELYGEDATLARALQAQNTINTTWTKRFADGYSVSCNITVRFRGPGSSAGNHAQIEAHKTSGPSEVNTLTRNMSLNTNNAVAFTWTVAHEFGHILGLDDRYSESIFSSVAGSFDESWRTSTVQPGYQGNLMGSHLGTLGSQNVADLASENAPSPYWMNDDDEIRNWINTHPNADIARLSTAHKLQAIHILMGGWISDDDINAMEKICRSVTTQDESRRIQQGIDLRDFSSIGQRTQMRVIFTRMPGGWIQ